MSLLPSEPDTSAVDEAEPRVIGVDSDDADDVLSALTSETARELLNELHREPAPPAELSDRVDTSLQNVQYHLTNLEEAGAIEVIDTIYSEKGREMNVYAPADQPLVIFAGKEEQTSGLRAALSRLLGSLGVLALASVAVQAVYGEGLLPFGTTGGGSGGSAPAEEQSGGGAGGASGGDAAAPAENATTTTTTDPSISADVQERAGESTDGFQVAEATDTPAETIEAGGGTVQPEATGTATEAPSMTPTAPPEADTPTQAATEMTGGGAGGDQIETVRAATETVTPAPTGTAAQAAPETATPAATEAATEAVNTTVQNATDAAASGGAEAVATAAAGGLPPGLVFFAGGATALAVGAAVLYVTR